MKDPRQKTICERKTFVNDYLTDERSTVKELLKERLTFELRPPLHTMAGTKGGCVSVA